jgi:hypothetical protein
MGKGHSLNCASYIAGIIEGMLNSAKMYAKVTAHLYSDEEEVNPGAAGAGGIPNAEDTSSTTIYVIKFAKEVTAREKT